MNKAPDIKEVKGLHSLDSPDPYKVFQFVSRENSKFTSNVMCTPYKNEQTLERGVISCLVHSILYDGKKYVKQSGQVEIKPSRTRLMSFIIIVTGHSILAI